MKNPKHISYLFSVIRLKNWKWSWEEHFGNRIPAASRFSRLRSTGITRNLTTKRLTMTLVREHFKKHLSQMFTVFLCLHRILYLSLLVQNILCDQNASFLWTYKKHSFGMVFSEWWHVLMIIWNLMWAANACWNSKSSLGLHPNFSECLTLTFPLVIFHLQLSWS